jgi:hypothetical protein
MKSPEMENFLEGFTSNVFGRSRKASFANATCVTCGKLIVNSEFKDALSVKEYGISGMCQHCQDSVFGTDDDEYVDIDEVDSFLERNADNL